MLSYAPAMPPNEIQEIADAQRKLNLGTLVFICCYVGMLAASGARIPALLMAVGIATTATLIFNMVMVFRLAHKLFNIGAAILLTVFLLIPFVNLLILLIVSSKATALLRRQGYKVGFMGVSADQLRTRVRIIR